MDTLSGSGTTEGQQAGKKRYRLDKGLEEGEEAGDPGFTNLKNTGKVKDAECEPLEISWRNDQSDDNGEEKKEHEQAAIPHPKEYADAIKLHNNIKLVGRG